MGQDHIPHRPRACSPTVRAGFPSSSSISDCFSRKRSIVYVVEGGQSRKIIYDQAYFDMPADSIARQLPEGAGFAGFRIQESRDGDARLAQERLGGLPRRGLFPLDRRTPAIWPVRARHRARRRGGDRSGRISRFHQFLYRFQRRRRQRRPLRADGRPFDRRRLSFRDEARQRRGDGHRRVAVHARLRFAFRHRRR